MSSVPLYLQGKGGRGRGRGRGGGRAKGSPAQRPVQRPGGLSSSSSSGYITLEQHHQPEDEDDSDTGSDDGGALDPAIFNGSILAHVEDDGAAAVVEKAVQAYASALGDGKHKSCPPKTQFQNKWYIYTHAWVCV